jgi:hypothetical protein
MRPLGRFSIDVILFRVFFLSVRVNAIPPDDVLEVELSSAIAPSPAATWSVTAPRLGRGR